MDEIATEFANWLKQHDVTLAPLLITTALLVGVSAFISPLQETVEAVAQEARGAVSPALRDRADDLARAYRRIVADRPDPDPGNLGRRPRRDLDRGGQLHNGRRRFPGDLDDGEQLDDQRLHCDLEAVPSRRHRRGSSGRPEGPGNRQQSDVRDPARGGRKLHTSSKQHVFSEAVQGEGRGATAVCRP
jgi:hypothetical protein